MTIISTLVVIGLGYAVARGKRKEAENLIKENYAIDTKK